MTVALSTPFARYESIWNATAAVPTYPRLDRDLATDVVVVGAGIAGLSVAYHLATAGREVIVLEDGVLASGVTRVTSAHLTAAMDNTYGVVESRRGTENARLAAESHSTAIDRIESVIQTEEIDCDFERLEWARVRAGAHMVTAGSVVVATNAPINDRVFVITKQAPYTTYVIGARVPPESVPDALFWDMDDPYHYVRLQHVNSETPHDVLILGGEDHKTGQADDTEKRHGRLERWARERFPMITGVEFRWSGQVMESLDGLAFIGRNPGRQDNVYVVTGDTGMGMTHGTIAGMLITDLILDRPNRWQSLYDPSRKPLKAVGRVLKENANVARQYVDWVLPGDPETTEDIPPGSGAVLREGFKKVAVYRDVRGAVYEFSAVCSHLGCIVQWNPTERTWDCPCHGSRYDKMGKVINGPANKDLRRVE